MFFWGKSLGLMVFGFGFTLGCVYIYIYSGLGAWLFFVLKSVQP